MKRLLWVFCLLLVACESTTEYDLVKSSAEQRLVDARNGQTKATELRHVVRSQGYFVPPLNLPNSEGPAWMQLPVHFAFDEYPLGRALKDLLAGEGISTRLLDDIDPEIPISLRLEGTLGEALARIALITGLAFTAEEGLVVWRQYEIAEFDVAFLAGVTNFFLGEDGMSVAQTTPNQGQIAMTGSSVNDDSTQYLNFTSQELSVWEDLTQALSMLLSNQGTIAINQSSTSVLVRDLPQHVQLVREYLLQQNERLTRQVAVDIQVIDVVFNDQDQRGIDWELIGESVSGSSVLNLFSAASSVALGEQSSGLKLNRQTGRLSGSEVIIAALREQGVVEVSNHPRMVTLNNQISKVVLEENVTYLASAGSSSTANVGSSDLLIPGVVRTGFELYLLPKIANEQILLQLSTSLSDLLGIDQISSGDKTIQTPQTTRKKFFMKAIVGNQETLLISGLQNTRRQWQAQQGLLPWLFGGQRKMQHQHTETIVLLTPRILSSGNML
ncbi:MAG TPA: hypothetical protein VKY35_02040 [Aliidiomarina sp.]|nr:hypothetical protein [Aliidiomarina sp.]